jgi:hypothetical protein
MNPALLMGAVAGARQNTSSMQAAQEISRCDRVLGSGSFGVPTGSFHTRSQVVCRMWARDELT